MVEILSQLKLDHHGKPGSIGRPFRPIAGLLSSDFVTINPIIERDEYLKDQING